MLPSHLRQFLSSFSAAPKMAGPKTKPPPPPTVPTAIKSSQDVKPGEGGEWGHGNRLWLGLVLVLVLCGGLHIHAAENSDGESESMGVCRVGGVGGVGRVGRASMIGADSGSS
jgi:hypothetical protein